MLPDEMWEEVLKFVDVFQLLELKTVSKHWCDLVTRVIKKECKWYEKCVQVVPEDTWCSILEHHAHPEICGDDLHRAKKHSEIWISLYRSWIGWNTMIKKSPSIETIDIFTEEQDKNECTCLDAKSNFIAVGTVAIFRDIPPAMVFFYDISKFSEGLIFQAPHESDINSVQLGRADDETIAVSVCGPTGIDYWNLRTKTQIKRREFIYSDVIPYRVPVISSSLGYCHILAQFSYNDEFLELGTLKVERMGTGIDLRSVPVPNNEHGIMRAMCANGNKTTMLMVSPYTSTSIYTSEPNDELKFVKQNEVNLDHLKNTPGAIGLLRFLLLNPCVAAYYDINKCREFGFSVNGREWKRYDTEEDFGLSSNLECMTYAHGLLILGFDSGEILIISVKNADGLERLNLKTMETQTLKLDSQWIRCVTVTEFNSQQYVVAVSQHKLHLVKFN